MNRLVSGFTAILFLITCGYPGADAHITPVVHLVKHNDAIKQLIPDGTSFFLRKVQIGEADLQEIKSAVGWTPGTAEYKFYYGKNPQGEMAGDALFISQDSKHGPIVLAVAFSPDNKIQGVRITDATVETVTWIKALMDHNFTDTFRGKTALNEAGIEAHLVQKNLGTMPRYFAGIITTGVERAIALQQTLFRSQPVQ